MQSIFLKVNNNLMQHYEYPSQRLGVDRNDMLSYVFALPRSKVHVSEKEMNYLIQNTDLHSANAGGYIPLLNALISVNSVEECQQLTDEQWGFLIKNSPLNKTCNNSMSALLYSCIAKRQPGFKLSDDNFDYLLKNSDLNITDSYGYNYLSTLIGTLDIMITKPSDEEWKYVFSHTNLFYTENVFTYGPHTNDYNLSVYKRLEEYVLIGMEIDFLGVPPIPQKGFKL